MSIFCRRLSGKEQETDHLCALRAFAVNYLLFNVDEIVKSQSNLTY